MNQCSHQAEWQRAGLNSERVSRAAIDEIEKLSKELGFEIVRCFADTLAINLKTAGLIGFSINLPIEVLAAADEFYREIIRPE